MKPDPKAKAWAKRNKWFGVDHGLTAYAYGLHSRLMKRKVPVDPKSVAYYALIDAGVLRYSILRKLGCVPADESRILSEGAKAMLKMMERVAKERGITLPARRQRER